MKIEQLEPDFQKIFNGLLEKLKATHKVVLISEPTFFLFSDGTASVSSEPPMKMSAEVTQTIVEVTQTIAEMKTRIILKRVILKIELNDIDKIIEDMVNEFMLISRDNIIYLYDKGFDVLNLEQDQKIFIMRFTTLYANF